MSLKHIIKHKKNFPIMSPSDTVMNAIERMRELESGVVVVVDGEKKLLGLLSERDVMFKIAAKHLDPKAMALDEVMTTDIIKIEDATASPEALNTMVEHRIRHLPVVTKDNEIVGVLSLRYLLHDRIDELRDELQALEAYLNDARGG